jgi:alkylation response protein AidB-like acyl-CoA dehydrogenase
VIAPVDFSFGEDQLMVRDLARGILEREVTPERLKRAAADGEWCDRALWSTLAQAGLLGLAVPPDLGGMGFGLLEVCVLLQEVGRAVAPVPALPALVLGGLAIADAGSDEQRRRWLAPLAAGEAILTGALVDAGSSDPARPATRARRDGGGWILDGAKRLVPAAGLARRIVVPAATGEGVGLFLVDPAAPGVTLARRRTSTGEPLFDVTLAGVRAGTGDLLGGDARGSGRGHGSGDARGNDDARGGAAAAVRLHERALVGVCATQTGVSERALEITTGYVRERVQFGVPIGSFQAVQHRAADCYLDLEAMRWVTWRAAWRLAQGRPAARETAVAKLWAAEGGARIAAAAQHLHGGIGVDLDYPIHRYFLCSKALELCLGGAAPHLARLGRDLARTGPPADA